MSAMDVDTATYGRFIGWWTKELAQIGKSQGTRGSAWRLMVLASRQGIVVFERRRSSANEVARWEPGADPIPNEARRALLALARKGLTKGERVVLRLEPNEVIRTSVTLPVAVRPITTKVLSNRLELMAPWPVDQVLFDHVETGVSGANFSADVIIGNRDHIDRLLGTLRAVGIEPGIVDAGSDETLPVTYNLHELSRTDVGRRQRRVARTLAALGIGVLIATGGLMAWEYKLNARKLKLEQSVQAAYKALRPNPGANGSGAGAAVHALDLRRATPTISLAIEALARRLPDDTVLDRLELRDGVVTLTGKATTPHGLVSLIETLPHFTNVQFVAPTTRASGEARSSFSLAARLQPVAGVPLP